MKQARKNDYQMQLVKCEINESSLAFLNLKLMHLLMKFI